MSNERSLAVGGINDIFVVISWYWSLFVPAIIASAKCSLQEESVVITGCRSADFVIISTEWIDCDFYT